MNVSFTPQLEYFVRLEVDSGLFSNAIEVIREGLRLMIEKVFFKSDPRQK
jgi:putative addiction module CopG family antidote